MITFALFVKEPVAKNKIQTNTSGKRKEEEIIE
jgi:hypothetical protein